MMKSIWIPILALLTLAPNSATSVDLRDVTEAWKFYGSVVTAFPQAHARIKKEENADIIRVFHYFQGDATQPWNERRIEVLYTGGDWMPFGLTYFVSNAPNPTRRVFSDQSAAYFIPDLSTTDLEGGETQPIFDPLDATVLRDFILQHFLEPTGDVRPEFNPL
jgi:hypothetical protein